MLKRNLIMASIGLIASLIISLYVSVFSNILTHPYMILMMSICVSAILIVIVYFFNVLVVKIKYSKINCKHNYHLINQYELKSKYELVCDSGRVPNTHLSMKRVLITDYKCSKCNKIKRLKANSI